LVSAQANKFLELLLKRNSFGPFCAIQSSRTISDRGRLATGLAADVVVFDPDTIGDNWDQRPTGVETVVLNGSVVVEAGRFDRTSRAGAVLR